MDITPTTTETETGMSVGEKILIGTAVTVAVAAVCYTAYKVGEQCDRTNEAFDELERAYKGSGAKEFVDASLDLAELNAIDESSEKARKKAKEKLEKARGRLEGNLSILN